jgi:hypothetical protein
MHIRALLLVSILAMVPILGMAPQSEEAETAIVEDIPQVDKLNPAQQDAISELDLGIQISEVGARAYGTNWAVQEGGSSNDYGYGIAVD